MRMLNKMSVINDLVKEVESEEVDAQIKELCDKISDEEKNKGMYPNLRPRGPNIFLALEIPGEVKGKISFLCLEREAQATYIVSVRSKIFSEVSKPLVKTRVWEIKEQNPDKILTEYAKKIKLLRGE